MAGGGGDIEGPFFFWYGKILLIFLSSYKVGKAVTDQRVRSGSRHEHGKILVELGEDFISRLERR